MIRILLIASIVFLVGCKSGQGSTGGTSGNEPAISTYKIEVEWDVPNRREDGSTLSLEEITAYRIHYGQNEAQLDYQVEIDDAVNLSHVIELPHSGLWYISMTAVDQNSLESELSGVQQINICALPECVDS